jgi:hypothetical protein
MSEIDNNEWTDPRPKYPQSGAVVMVKRANGVEQKMVCESTWEGMRWKSFPNGRGDSIAHSQIVGWRHLRPTE